MFNMFIVFKWLNNMNFYGVDVTPTGGNVTATGTHVTATGGNVTATGYLCDVYRGLLSPVNVTSKVKK